MKKLTITLLLLLAFSLHGQSPKANTDPALPFKAVRGMSMDEVVAAQGKPTMIDDAYYKRTRDGNIEYVYEGVEWQGLGGRLVYGFNSNSNFNVGYIFFFPYTKDLEEVRAVASKVYKPLTADEYLDTAIKRNLEKDPHYYDKMDAKWFADLRKDVRKDYKEGSRWYDYEPYLIRPYIEYATKQVKIVYRTF